MLPADKEKKNGSNSPSYNPHPISKQYSIQGERTANASRRGIADALEENKAGGEERAKAAFVVHNKRPISFPCSVSPHPLLKAPVPSYTPLSQSNTPIFFNPMASMPPLSASGGVRIIRHHADNINIAPTYQENINVEVRDSESKNINIGVPTFNCAVPAHKLNAQAESSRDFPLPSSPLPVAVNFYNSPVGGVTLPSLSQKIILDWETLIACVKKNYLSNDKIKNTFDEAQPLETCYVNLAIVEEREQQEKAKKLAQDERNKEQQDEAKKHTHNEISREAWLNSYEELHGVKSSILPADIFKGEAQQDLKRLLLLGRAGIGKSVLCQYLAYQWAKGGLWQDASFSLVIWVPLRQLANDYLYPKGGKPIILGKVVYELIKDRLNDLAGMREEEPWIQALDELLRIYRTKILYVLDGYDEVASLLDKKAHGRQAEILENLLKQERVLITSRPYYIDHYLSSQGIKIERRLENIGFIEENIHDYIQRYPW